MKTLFAFAILVSCAFAVPAHADQPKIVAVDVSSGGNAFAVTLLHSDTGWDHYADAWEILSPDGQQIGIRELAHPHETEQPFTRTLDGLIIPLALDHVLIRARCSVDGWTETIRVDLPGR